MWCRSARAFFLGVPGNDGPWKGAPMIELLSPTPHFQRYCLISISCFWIDIDPMSEIPSILLHRSSFFFGPRPFRLFPAVSSSKIYGFPNILFSKGLFGFFWSYLEYPGVPKNEIIWLVERWTRSKIPKSWNGGWGCSHKQIEKLYVQSDRNTSLELVSLVIP